MSDLLVLDHGSVVLIVPESAQGVDWLSDNVAEPLWFGPGMAVEPRYVGGLLAGAVADGLAVA